MHESNAGDEGRNESSQNEQGDAEGWFRFGDEPDTEASEASEATGHRPADSAPTASSTSESASASSSSDDAGAPDEPPAHRPAASTRAPAEPEERIQPFVVSATPGGVDLDMKEAADAAVVTSVGGGRGFGLVGALTVMLALFGAGMFFLVGPRAADAESRSGAGLWMTDIDQATALAAAEGKPLIVHFTADWCPPCRAMRENVLESAVVEERLAERFITVRVDLTNRGGPNNQIAAQFDVRSIPDMQVYHPDGWQMQRFGYVSSAGEFLGKLASIDRD